jgi:hypothetical protein
MGIYSLNAPGTDIESCGEVEQRLGLRGNNLPW